jgi:hypothetical protein
MTKLYHFRKTIQNKELTPTMPNQNGDAAQLSKNSLPINAGVLMSIILLLLFTMITDAATITSTATGGNWATGSTWVGGTAPASGDQVIIATTGSNTVQIAANLTQTAAGSVTVNNGATLSATTTGVTVSLGTLTINTGGTVSMQRNLTVQGTTNISGTLTFGSTSGTSRVMTFTGDVTLNSGANWNETTTGAAATFSFGGSFTNDATTFTAQNTAHNFTGATKTLNGTTTITFPTATFTGNYANSGTLTCSTLLTVTGAAIRLTNNGTINSTAVLSGTGGVTQGATGILNIGGTSTITTLTATATGNLVNYTGAAQTCKVTTYYNLTLSGTGTATKTFATTPTVNGVLSLEGTATVVVTGTGVVTYGPSATLQYNKPASYTATAEEWITPFTASGGVRIAGAGTITINVAKTIGNGSKLDLENGILAAGTNITIVSTSTINRSGGSITGTLQGTGVYNVNYTGNTKTTGPELSGSGFNNVTVNLTSGQILTLDQNRAPNGNVTITSGTFDLSTFTFNRSASGGTLTVSNLALLKIGGTNSLPGNYSTHTLGGSSYVEYSGTNQTVTNESYGHLLLSGSGTKTLPSAGTLSILGGLTLSGSVSSSIDNAASIGGNLAIGSGTVLTVNAGKTLSVGGGASLGSAQCLVLKSDATGTASFIDNGTISGAGYAKVERYLTPYDVSTDMKFHFLSSPVGSAQAIMPEFQTMTNSDIDFYMWGEVTNEWINTKQGTNSPYTWNTAFGEGNGAFDAGKGYLVAYPTTAVTKNFIGKPFTNAGLVVPCTNTATGGQGWNLVGNPFPSAINWNTVTKTNVDNALYYYDNSIPGYVYYIDLTGGTGSATNIIPPEQGFMVHANSATGSITMKNSDRVHQSTNTYYKNGADVLTDNVLNIWVEGNEKLDNARVCFYGPATENFDGEYDAYKLFSYAAVPELYSVTPDNTLLAINTLPLSQMSGAITVGFTPGADGTFTFNSEGMENFAADVNITLNDLKLNTTQDLKQNSVYTFSSSTNDDANRFQLLFGVVGIGEQPETKTVSRYFANGNLYVTTNSDVTNVSIFNMQGQQLQNFTLYGKGQQYRPLNLPTGIYIARLMIEGKMQTLKINVQ